MDLANAINRGVGVTRGTGGGRASVRRANQRIATAARRRSRGGAGG